MRQNRLIRSKPEVQERNWNGESGAFSQPGVDAMRD
jgi:hypothetical protein